MAIYRTVQLSFWTDTKVEEDFTPEDKYFYLYLFTNPHTNLSGCYELGLKQAARETGYSAETIERLIERFENVHNIIVYSKETKEILLLNWHKYNWTKSGDFMKGLDKHIEKIKNSEFKQYLLDINNGIERVYRRSTDRVQTSVTVTDTVTDADTVYITDTVKKKSNKKVPAVYYPTDDLLNQAFTDYVEMRKQLKKPMTGRAVQLAMKKLETLAAGDNDKAIKILEQSVERSWAGLFELKESGGKKSGGIDWDSV